MKTVVLFLLGLVFLKSVISIETFSAIVDLKLMLETEKFLAGHIKDYIENEYTRLRNLKRVVKEFERHSLEALKQPEDHVSNPLNAYKLVKRLTRDWHYVRDEYISSKNVDDFLKLINELEASFPDNEDLSGAASALFRLVDTYSLDPLHLSLGHAMLGKNISFLSFYELYELGLLAFENKNYYHNYLFFNATLVRLPVEQNEEDENGVLMRSYQVTQVKLLGYMAFSLYKLGNVYKAYILTLELLRIDPVNSKALENKELLEKVLKEVSVNESRENCERSVERPLEGFKKDKEFSDYEKLCRGEELFPNHDWLAHCRYKRHHPMFFMRPLKEEVISVNPWIAMYHEALKKQETSQIIRLANPKLNRAMVHDTVTGKERPTDYRIGKNAWLNDTDTHIRSMSRTSAAIVNLTLDTAEYLQVLNYGIGGHYEPHYDFSTKEEENNFEIGNRILTYICYLSNVQAGGSTVFPIIGVNIKPRKGSCVVWYNLLHDGGGDRSTWHAACPVMIGNKWVANKWFHERGQEFARRCSLNPDVHGGVYSDNQVIIKDEDDENVDGGIEDYYNSENDSDLYRNKQV